MRVQTIEKTVYKFAELSESVKQDAISAFYRDEWSDLDSVIDDACRIADILGIEFDMQSVPTHGGARIEKPAIHWSGFWSQGDGLSFTGNYSYRKGCVARLKEYAPQDEVLHSIAADLVKAARAGFFLDEVKIGRHSSMYCHDKTMMIAQTVSGNRYNDIGTDRESAFLEAFQAFARWIYRALETEYNYHTSIEAFAELCEANDYEFDESGNLA